MNKHLEIERKFLVTGDFQNDSVSSMKISQGYLSSVPERTVRVRILGDKGFLTVKGIGDETGTSRFEWEKEISLEDASKLLNLCEPGIIEKVRYFIPEGTGLVFEVDAFYGENEGLTIAEIELPDLSYEFEKPNWLGEEVTGIQKYYNASLRKCPYKKWKPDTA